MGPDNMEIIGKTTTMTFRKPVARTNTGENHAGKSVTNNS